MITATASDPFDLEKDLAYLEEQVKIGILIDAIMSKTGFIRLRFPKICNKGLQYAPALTSTSHIELKTKGIFNVECATDRFNMGDVKFFFDGYSNDLMGQTHLARSTMEAFIDYSDHLPACEADYMKNLIEPIINDLEDLDLDIMHDSHEVEKEMGTKKYFYFQKFFDDLKRKIRPLEDKWNAAAAEGFNKLERVSKAHPLRDPSSSS